MGLEMGLEEDGERTFRCVNKLHKEDYWVDLLVVEEEKTKKGKLPKAASRGYQRFDDGN